MPEEITVAPMPDDALNSGVLLRNIPDQLVAERTYVAMGLSRGGTTMVARVLHELGIHIGTNLNRANAEDLVMQAALRDEGDFGQLVERRNREHAVWAVKTTNSFRHLDKLQQLRAPHYILIVRDVAAMAVRKLVAGRLEQERVFTNLATLLRGYGELFDFLRESEAPMVICSYEKAVAHPETFAQALATFVGCDDQSRISKARDAIVPESPEYLRPLRGRQRREARAAGDSAAAVPPNLASGTTGPAAR